MGLILGIVRKTKANFIRFKLHVFIDLFAGVLANAIYLAKLSKWIRQTPMPVYNDFYTKKRDYNKRYDLYRHVIESEKLVDVQYLEFGVAQGHSFKWWVSNIHSGNSRFYGFDTFSGLHEDWGHFKKGDMSAQDSYPVTDDARCQYLKGIFQETLPSFLLNFESDMRKVVHMDADLYTSTLFVLSTIGPYLREGDILIFDEFNVPLHEFKAFTEFLSSYYVKVVVIGAVNNYYQIAFRILENSSFISGKTP